MLVLVFVLLRFPSWDVVVELVVDLGRAVVR